MVNKPLRCVTIVANEPQDMTNSTAGKDKWYQDAAAAQIHMEQLKTVERFNGRAAMLGLCDRRDHRRPHRRGNHSSDRPWPLGGWLHRLQHCSAAVLRLKTHSCAGAS
mgnify:CR=1 FL=1